MNSIWTKLVAVTVLCVASANASGQETMKVEIPFGKLDAKTLNSIMSINRRIASFSEGCTKEADEAADKLYRSLWTSAACGASLGASETGIGLVAAAIACTSSKYAYDDRLLAAKGLQECRAMQSVHDKYKEHCSAATAVMFFESNKVHCVDSVGRLVYVVDFKSKTIDIYKKK